MTGAGNTTWLDDIHWNDSGLIPVIAQEEATGQVLTLAWMNRDALLATVAEGRAVYWSRSRGKLWRKGEQSGHIQWVKQIHLDCDNDAILLTVAQEGGIACHTGRRHCFFRKLEDGAWKTIEQVIRNPEEIYADKMPGE